MRSVTTTPLIPGPGSPSQVTGDEGRVGPNGEQRRSHYRAFYQGPEGPGPFGVVYGNCQAEAVRVVLEGSPTFPVELVRIPPVHELDRSDLPHLSRLLRRCLLLLSQPVRPAYRGLPIGTRDLEPWLPAAATVVRWPVLRYEGLHPFTAIVRHPLDPTLEPPIVPYHDLRNVARAAGRRSEVHLVGPEAYRAVAEASLGELRRREAPLDVSVADEVARLGVAAMHVINHPGNGVVIAVARGLQRALGLPVDAPDPGRTLLGRIRAPLEAPVLAALHLPDPPQEEWRVDDRDVAAGEIAEAHLGWYGRHPACVAAAVERHAERMVTLGL